MSVSYTHLELDICDKQAVWAYIAEKRIELIVNCAAYTAVDNAEDNPELAYKLNCEAAKELASAAQFNLSLIHIL